MEIDYLKGILIENNYPLRFTDSFDKSYLNNLHISKVSAQTALKRNVFMKLPFLKSTSLQIRKKLQKLFTEN